MQIEFWIPLAPVAQERPRFRVFGRGKRTRVSAHSAPKTKEYQNAVRDYVRQVVAEQEIPVFHKDQPLYLECIFYLARPASAKKRIAPYVRPDLSNYLKAIEDSIQPARDDSDPALVEDDSSVCALYCEKRYVDHNFPEPGVMVLVSKWEPIV